MDTPHNICDSVLVALRRIVRSIDLHSKRLVSEYGITGPQALVLKCLIDTEPVSVGELARRVNLSQATVTDILDRLARRELIQRVRSETDKRRVLVTSTDAGKGVARQAPPLLQDHFVAEFEKLNEWEQTLILSSLQRVAAMMDAEDIDAAPVLESQPIDGSAAVVSTGPVDG